VPSFLKHAHAKNEREWTIPYQGRYGTTALSLTNLDCFRGLNLAIAFGCATCGRCFAIMSNLRRHCRVLGHTTSVAVTRIGRQHQDLNSGKVDGSGTHLLSGRGLEHRLRKVHETTSLHAIV
jgi:hypothetical protein